MYRFLIAQGAKETWTDCHGYGPAATALVKDRVYSVRNYGWDPEDLAETLEFSSLHSAVTLQSLSAEGFQSLLQQDFMHVNTHDRLGKTPLHWAARNGDSDAVELLIEWKAHVNVRDVEKWTPLHEACWSGNERCVTLLLDAGGDVRAEDQYGQTPLFSIAWAGCGLVALLVQRGGEIDHRNHDGETVLHHAAWEGCSDIIDELVMHGADIIARDPRGISPLQRAIIEDEREAVLALLRSSKAHEVGIPCLQNIIFASISLKVTADPLCNASCSQHKICAEC